MKHAGDEALDALEPLLTDIRALGGLKEKKRGVFYRKSKAFLHFHEDPAGLFADLLCDGVRTRLCVTSPAERADFLGEVTRRISGTEPRRSPE
jgi:hypothetical protein